MEKRVLKWNNLSWYMKVSVIVSLAIATIWVLYFLAILSGVAS